MALGPLTLDVTYGVAGRPFQATVSGQSNGSTIDVVGGRDGGTYGFGYSNGRVAHPGLPALNRVTVVLRETLAGQGTRDSRIDIAVDGIPLGAAGLMSSLAGVGFSPLQQKLKRAASRAAAFNPDINPVATGVTFTNSASAGTGLAKTLQVSTNLAKFSFRGGVPTVNSNLRIVMPVSTNAPATDGGLASTLPATPGYNAAGFEFGFTSAAPLLEVRAGGNGAHTYRWRVDDQYINKSPVLWTGSYSRFDWGGVVKDRNYVLESMGSAELIQVALPDGTYDVSPLPSIGDRVIMLSFSDSYGIGQNTNSQFMTYPSSFARRTGVTDARVVGIGGTGYISTGTPTRKKLRDQIPDVIAINSDIDPAKVDIVMVGDGYNDRNQAASGVSAALAAEATLAYQALRAAFPNALIIVVGPWPGIFNGDTIQLNLEQSVLNGFNAWADPFSLYVPVNADPNKWMYGTGYTGATNGTGDTDYLMSNDGVHPSLLGQDRLERRIELAYRRYLGLL